MISDLLPLTPYYRKKIAALEKKGYAFAVSYEGYFLEVTVRKDGKPITLCTGEFLTHAMGSAIADVEEMEENNCRGSLDNCEHPAKDES